jgi:hypothetical protein
MKLKLTILLALFAAGVFASLALAEGGKHARKADGCHEVHIAGTIAPQTFAVTVTRASDRAQIPAGTTLNVPLGTAGQTVQLKAEACVTGTGTAAVLTVKQVELRLARVHPARTGTTQTGTTQTGTTQAATTQTGTTQTTTTRKHDDDHGHRDHHKGGTTTSTSTTTTTAGTTTTTR